MKTEKDIRKERQELKYFVVFLLGLVVIFLAMLSFPVKAEEENIIAVIETKEEGRVYDPKIGVYVYSISESPADGASYDNNVGSEASDGSSQVVDGAYESDEGGDQQGDSVTEVYVPDSDDDCPVSDKVPISVELQEYLWTRCKKACPDNYKNYYAFCLGVMQHESTFRPKATHKNGNGSVDRGIMQINSSNIKKMTNAGLISSSDDLFDPFKCVDCGLHMLNNYISKFGISESAYYAYNTGREREGSNKNSRIVWGYYQNWKEILFS